MRINEQISASTVRVVREGEQVGVMTLNEALRMADESGLDLVEIAPQAEPPVARIMDYGKFKYEQAKRDRESRRGSKQVELREVRMKVKIDQHDIEFKARTARKLLEAGDKVKVSVMFRARRSRTPRWGASSSTSSTIWSRIAGRSDRPPTMEGRFMSMLLEPVAKREPAQRPVAEPEPAATVA